MYICLSIYIYQSTIYVLKGKKYQGVVSSISCVIFLVLYVYVHMCIMHNAVSALGVEQLSVGKDGNKQQNKNKQFSRILMTFSVNNC